MGYHMHICTCRRTAANKQERNERRRKLFFFTVSFSPVSFLVTLLLRHARTRAAAEAEDGRKRIGSWELERADRWRKKKTMNEVQPGKTGGQIRMYMYVGI